MISSSLDLAIIYIKISPDIEKAFYPGIMRVKIMMAPVFDHLKEEVFIYKKSFLVDSDLNIQGI